MAPVGSPRAAKVTINSSAMRWAEDSSPEWDRYDLHRATDNPLRSIACRARRLLSHEQQGHELPVLGVRGQHVRKSVRDLKRSLKLDHPAIWRRRRSVAAPGLGRSTSPLLALADVLRLRGGYCLVPSRQP
jgi:hypothetical protein